MYTHGEYLCIIYGLNAINSEKMLNDYKKHKIIFVNCETKKSEKKRIRQNSGVTDKTFIV